MEKCWLLNCSEEVTMRCSCTAEGVFTCFSHVLLHSQSSGNPLQHAMTPIVMELPQSKQQEAVTKILALIKQLESIKNISISNNKLAISMLNEQLNKFLKSLREIQYGLRKFFKRIFVNKPINQNTIEKISSILLNLNARNASDTKIIQSLSQLYNFESAITKSKINADFENEDCENALCFDKTKEPKLINLATFNSCSFSCCSVRAAVPVCAKIGPELYFVSGGYNGSVCNKACIVDIKKNICKTLAFKYQMHSAGSVCMDQVVYIFGGYNGSLVSNLCQAYDLRTNLCTRIASLPQASHINSAGKFNNNIFVSGYNMDKVYKFDGKAFSVSLPRTANSFKLVCDGWIITTGKIYEISTKHFSEWLNYSTNYNMTYLNPDCCYKRQNYIYFIVCSGIGTLNKLSRFNTQSKVIEDIPYS
jgi:hypothetical protein